MESLLSRVLTRESKLPAPCTGGTDYLLHVLARIPIPVLKVPILRYFTAGIDTLILSIYPLQSGIGPFSGFGSETAMGVKLVLEYCIRRAAPAHAREWRCD